MPEMYLTKDYNLRTSDFDMYARIRPRSILDIMQDIAGDHAIMLGCGIQQLPARGLAWVLTKSRYQLLKQPDMYAKVHVKTWPLKPGKITYRRECEMRSLEGELLVVGTSEWVIMSFEDRKLRMVSDLYPSDNSLTALAYPEEKIKKIPPVQEMEAQAHVTANYMDQDTNFHVNNIVYADYIMNFLRPTDEIERFEIDYHKEVRVDEEIILRSQVDAQGRILVDGIASDAAMDTHLFHSALTLRQRV